MKAYRILKKDLHLYHYELNLSWDKYGCYLYKGRSKKPVAVYPSLCDFVIALGALKLEVRANGKLGATKGGKHAKGKHHG